ncbi:di-heme oxidoredictase family protein [Methyloprofundus sp.]|uniref:di-heme oxidoreductase family protein n=1 Tax=Methyloprofundus sp. TaxID=2020875 RepID=UPI003D1071FF
MAIIVVLYATHSMAATHTRDTIFLNGEKAGAQVEFNIQVPSEANISEADMLSVSATFASPKNSIGGSGQLYLVAIQAGVAWVKTAESTWVPWDRSIASLIPLQIYNDNLPANIQLSIVENLHDLPGDITLYIGFEGETGQFLFTSPAVQFSIKQNFSEAEQNEHLLGGSATSFTFNADAFSRPSASLGVVRRLDFSVGNSFFRNPWVPAPTVTTARDGLGPLFNTNACQNCHIKDGRGHPPENDQDSAISMLMRLSVPAETEQEQLLQQQHGPLPEPNYGGQLQDFSSPNIDPEGQVKVSYTGISERFTDGYKVELRQPTFHIEQLKYGPFANHVMTSPRVAPPMIGLGLIDTIPQSTILAREDPIDLDNDGISGRVNWVWDVEKQGQALGRYGWKLGQPTVRQQSAGAFNGDMGLTSSIFPADECTAEQVDCLLEPNGGDPEVSDEILDFVVFYSSNLAVPARRNVNDPVVLQGKKLFNEALCAACHIPTLRTGDSQVFPELANQTIHPFTDLLLHDMGEGLADNRPEFLANGREWRTTPLWGIGMTETVNGHTNFLHDGRARNLMEAILWHNGEAETSKQRVLSFDAEQRNALIKFLESL